MLRMPRFQRFQIRQLLLGWAIVSIVAIILIATTSSLVSFFSARQQAEFTSLALPIEHISNELSQSMSRLARRQAEVLTAGTEQALTQLPSRSVIELHFKKELQNAIELTSDTDSFTPVLERLAESFEQYLEVDDSLEQESRSKLRLEQEMKRRTGQIESNMLQIQHLAESISGRINLMSSRNRRELRQQLGQTQLGRDELIELIQETLLGRQLQIQKNSSQIRLGVIHVSELSLKLIDETNRDLLISLSENDIRQQFRLIENALRSLQRALSEYGELNQLTQQLLQRFNQLTLVVLDDPASAYRLKLSTFEHQDRIERARRLSESLHARLTEELRRLSNLVSDLTMHSAQSSREYSNLSQRTVILISLFLSILMSLLVYVLTRRISEPLQALRDAMHDLSSGNLSRRLKLDHQSRDEFSEMAHDFNLFAESNEVQFTQLQQARQDIEASQNWLSTILDGVPDGLLTTDSKGNILSTNPAARALLKTGEESLPDLGVSEIFASNNLHTIRQILNHTLPGSSPLYHGGDEMTVIDLGGNEVPVWVSVNAMQTNNEAAYIFVISDLSAFKQAEESRRQSEALFKTLYENLPIMVAGFDIDGQCILWNRELEHTLGWTYEDASAQKNVVATIYPELSERLRVLESIRAHDGVFREFHPLSKSGQRLTHMWANFELPDGTLISTGYDISERTEIEQQLKQASSELDTILENALVGIAYIRENTLIRVNSRFEQLFKQQREQVEGQTLQCLFPDRINYGRLCDDAYPSIERGGNFEKEIRMSRGDASLFWCALSIKAIDPLNPHRGSIWLFEDVTRRRETEDKLRHLANYDVLTGLPNRSLFQDRLYHAIQSARRNEHYVALLFLDLDHFKHINDSLGHAAGDSLLCEIANRLTSTVREQDTVSRLGGDEFTIIIEQTGTPEQAGTVARKLLSSLSRPIQLESTEVNVSPSIGISIFPDDGDNIQNLLRNADAAMYHAKQSGRNTYQFYSPEMNATAADRLELENDLRRALTNDEFILHYQPQFRIDTRELVGMEALLRWDRPGHGLIPPDQFIPILEETGLIIEVGDWVINQACKEYMRLFHGHTDQIALAINLSARQFRDHTLLDRITLAIHQHRFPIDCLELEITESVIMEDSLDSINTLKALHDQGIRLAVDDFGTGYSSLAYLKRFPIDCLKVDRSFVNDITTDKDDAAIIEAIIALARRLELDVVAEGVETEQQLEFLYRNSCQRAQGFLLGKPMTATQLAARFGESNVIPLDRPHQYDI